MIKSCFESLTDRKEREVFENFERVLNTWKANDLKKTLYAIFDWSKNRFDQSKIPSIDPAAIEHWSNQADSKQNFNRNFDQSRNEINWSKIWKNQIFQKQSNFMQKLLKAWYDEYEMKCFSKTLVLNLDLPKIRFLINFP